MASKDDMLLQAEAAWTENREFFTLAKIDHVKFFRWFTGFKKHSEMKKAYTFVFGKLFKELMMVKYIWNKYKKGVNWKLQLLAQPSHYTCKELMLSVSILRETWMIRPKSKRKSE